MDEHAALLTGIAFNPTEHMRKLVYADWLDEHDGWRDCQACGACGEIRETSPHRTVTFSVPCSKCNGTGKVRNHFAARADFIRAGIELGYPVTYDKQWREIPTSRRPKGHLYDLLNEHAEDWESPWQTEPIIVTWRYGFPYQVRAKFHWFLGHQCWSCRGPSCPCNQPVLKGRQPSPFAYFIQRFPVQSIVVLDKIPEFQGSLTENLQRLRPGLPGTHRFACMDDSFTASGSGGTVGNEQRTAYLPRVVFDRLPGGTYAGHIRDAAPHPGTADWERARDERGKFWNNSTTADKDLGDVLLALMRENVGIVIPEDSDEPT